MRTLVLLLSTLVRRFPVFTVVGAVVLTGVLGAFSTRAVVTTGNESFSPDNEELRALETAGELFSGSDETVIQVLIRAEEGRDVIGADGLAAVASVREAVLSSDAARFLSARPDRPPVVSYLAGVEQVLAAEAGGSAVLDDAEVDELFRQGLAQAPAEQAGLIRTLVAQSGDPDAANAPAGLALVFLDSSLLEGDSGNDRFEALVEAEQAVAAAVESAPVPEGLSAEAFAFELLFADQGAFQSEVSRLFAMAALIIVAILAFVYFVRPVGNMTRLRALRRSASDVGMTLAAIIMSITWMQGLGVLLGPDYLGVMGYFAETTQILPILLIGLGVDFAIHMNSRYREEIGAGNSPSDAAVRASRTVGVALVLATITTAVGFLTNVTNPLPALRDFGILAAVGIFCAFVLMLTFVPSVRLLLDRRAERAGRLRRAALAQTSDRLLPDLMARTAVLAERFAISTLAVTLVLGGFGAYGLSRLSTEFSFTDFIPQDSPLLSTLETIQEEFAGGFGETTNVLVEGPVATPQAHNAMVAVLGELGDTPGVVTFGDQAAASSPVSVLAMLMAPPEGAPAEAAEQSAAFAARATEFGLQPDLTVAAGGDVDGLYAATLDAAPELAGRAIHRAEDGTFTTLLAVQTQAGEDGVRQLAAGLREDLAPLTAADVTAIPTSNNIVADVIIRELQESQIVSLFITLAAAMVLLVATFWVQARRPFLGVVTIGPVALVVLWTFGMMAATGIPFGPVTAILSALAIGIGVPFTIHITHRFQEDRERFDTAAEAITSTVRHTGGALAGSALTTMAGFGILMTSSLVPFRQMGQVTVYAIGFALIASVLVLPSMLVLWDGWHRRRGRSPVVHKAIFEEGEPAPEPAAP